MMTSRLKTIRVGQIEEFDEYIGQDPNDAFEASDNKILLHKILEAAAEQLNDREIYIIKHRLLSDNPMTLEKIGYIFGVCRERVRQQISALILRKLRIAAVEIKAIDED